MTAEQARQILHTNDRGSYAVPTARLHPFQWNWDSDFVALGWACFDEARAWQEILSLLRGQWEDGLLPQIVFDAPSDHYFPGPDVWGIVRTPPTSGITQPPVLATAVRIMLDTARDAALAERMAAEITPQLLLNHRWWQAARDPHGSGLVATLHPWETGMDNSPAWDAALARVPTDTVTTIRRRDTALVDASARPRGEEYQRFIHLVDAFRAVGWDAARMYAVSPFRVADIGTNAILLRAERDLLARAARFATPADAAEIGARIALKEAALPRLWNAALNGFASYDQDRRYADPGRDLGRVPAAIFPMRDARADRGDGGENRALGHPGAASGAVHRSGPSGVRATSLLARSDLGRGELDDR